MPENIAQALDMSHLREEKERVDREYAELNKPPETETKANPAFLQPEATFTVNYTDWRGKVYSGQFTNKVLTVGQKIKVDVLRARRMMNTPRDAMTDNIAGLLLMVSWMEESLTARPKWAANFWDLYDERIVEAVFTHVAEHEKFFHGRDQDTGAGEG
ncbi:MAG: hypothetical protein EOO40_02705 [Deltaproteobacteria bacterium]|nr:MAG: hypothetical protein EOO40_02705 [Deltaproteobacteria bacterium]